MNVELFIKENYLHVEIKNTSKKNYYVNKISFHDSIRMIDPQGHDVTAQYFLNEFNYHSRNIDFFKKKNIQHTIIEDYDDLFSPPITKRKKQIEIAVEKEFNSDYAKRLPKGIDSSDIDLIKRLLFSKYCNSIFIDSKSVYRDSISIYTLPDFNNELSINFKHNSVRENEIFNLDINKGKDTITIGSTPLGSISDYEYYSGTLLSNVLLFNAQRQD